jgi:hypothetical protein
MSVLADLNVSVHKKKVILDVLNNWVIFENLKIGFPKNLPFTQTLRNRRSDFSFSSFLIRFFKKFHPKKDIVPARRQGQCL